MAKKLTLNIPFWGSVAFGLIWKLPPGVEAELLFHRWLFEKSAQFKQGDIQSCDSGKCWK